MTVCGDALRDELNGLTPRLRRYARALTSGQATASELADDLVHATLMRALGARHVGAASELMVRLYATVTQLNREIALSGQQARAAGDWRPTLVKAGRSFHGARQTRLSAALLALPLESREALLLVGLEGFDYPEAARILRISRSVLINRLTRARTDLESLLHAAPSLIQSHINATGARRVGANAGIESARETMTAGPEKVGRAKGHLSETARRRGRAPYLRLVT